ncbi:MAG: outer membrane beta-barrel protein [Lentisphaerae bacterium]|nr:outer membrane beta-barrel protein [Lentisphaerota bacterium]
MKHTFCLMGMMALAAMPIASQDASAQGANGSGDRIKKTSETLKFDTVKADSQGFAVAPGIIVTPYTFTEGGYDSNPDQSFDEEGTPFLRSGVGANLAGIWKRTAAELSASGSWAHFADEDLPRTDRLNGTVSGNVAYLLRPGLTIAGGGLFDHDELGATEDETAAGYAELAYNDALLTSFLRGRFIDVQYLSDDLPDGIAEADSPFFLTSAFDVERTELSAGAIIGKNSPVGIYGEVTIADVDYVNQANKAVLDRDADDQSIKGGVRFGLSAYLRADVGWRWNRRNLEDPVIDDFESSYFDGSLTWAPSSYFYLSASIERLIGEPSAAFGRLSDIKQYELKANYVPVDGINVSLRAIRQHTDEIGNEFEYQSSILDAELSYDYSRRVQIYTSLRYEHLEEDGKTSVSDREYDRFRVAAGLRVVPDADFFSGRHLNTYMSLKDTDPLYRNLRLPSGAELALSVGPSFFVLPEIFMTSVVGGKFFDEAQFQIEDHDGNVNGIRTDIGLDNFAQTQLSDGVLLSFGIDGFYGSFSGSDRSTCAFTATTDCAFVNILDFDLNEENNTGSFGDFFTDTERNVQHWGVSLHLRPGDKIDNSLKDTTKFNTHSPLRFGFSLRGLTDETDLSSFDPLVPKPVEYDATIETYYYGAFVGIEKTVPLNDGWSLTLDGTGGVYYAETDYEGQYLGYVPVGANDFIVEKGALNLENDKATFIGGVDVSLEKKLEFGSISLFGSAEYIGYVPSVAINNNDNAGGSPFGVAGTQNGTRLNDDDAMNYSAGVKLKFNID